MLYKPSTARYKYTLDATSAADFLQMAKSPREIVSILVTAGGSGATIGIYDTANGTPLDPGDPKEAIFIAANTGESTEYSPSQPIPMRKGIFIRIEQGGDPFNGKVFILAN